ncbi:hypothetical protein [Longimicrobium sp.]|jgi:hypothetical protein|uniref:hypothetical protein n=1 Tax=Longimicrobium sp. TaxID=2029185 RepID=UPI002F95E43E
MYRNCIFCSAALGSNKSIEHFPAGKTLAFDAAKGRLWAVCPKCARWNLAPIEARWEAIEEAEKQFRETRLRAHSENIGLARLRDGTRLVRVGKAVPGELALWRYGAEMQRRWRGTVVSSGLMTAMIVAGAFTGVFLWGLAYHVALLTGIIHPRHDVYRFGRGALLPDDPVVIDTTRLRQAKVVRAPDGAGMALWFPYVGTTLAQQPDGRRWWVNMGATITGADAQAILRRGMVHFNRSGASPWRVRGALDLLSEGGAPGYLETAAGRRQPLWDTAVDWRERGVRLLALEMALHEENERRAMEGELGELQAMWREAEAIAEIADRLPDALDEEVR